MRLQDSTPVGAVQVPLRSHDGTVRAYALVDAADAEWVNRWHWSLHLRGYAVRHQMIDGKQRAIMLHRQILGLTHGDGLEGDHINHDRLDCRRSNLRIVPKYGNRQNVPSRSGSSAYRGVTWFARRNKWMARVQANGKAVHVGYFDDEHEAGRAAAEARARLLPFSVEEFMSSRQQDDERPVPARVASGDDDSLPF